MPRVPLKLALPGVVLAVVTLGLGVGGQLLMGLSETAAQGLMHVSAYVEAVSTS